LEGGALSPPNFQAALTPVRQVRRTNFAVSMQIVGSELARDSGVKIACKQASYSDHLTISCSRAEPWNIE
jgi:hypothetical protein